jgi:hypothetical protein
MNGSIITTVRFLGGVPSEWKLKQVGDMNEDGKVDLIWHNQANGLVAIWLMDGLSIKSTGFPGSQSTEWEIQ